MKTLDYIVFWAVFSLVCVPVLFGLMTDEIIPSFLAVLYAAIWWAIFNKTKAGRKAFRKGYRIACHIMGDCDV